MEFGLLEMVRRFGQHRPSGYKVSGLDQWISEQQLKLSSMPGTTGK